MLLTDDEIYGMYSEPSSDAEMVAFARAIEAAILAKLASAELPEPALTLHGKHKNGKPSAESLTLFNADQLRQAYAQGAASQLSAEPVGHFGFVESSQIWEEFHAPAGIPLFTRKEPK